MAIDFATDEGRVRLLINDVDESQPVFDTDEVEAFLDMEGGSVKRAAAQALDTIADNEALTAKVITSQDLKVDGAALANSLRARANALRDQADTEAEATSGHEFFVAGFAPYGAYTRPELT